MKCVKFTYLSCIVASSIFLASNTGDGMTQVLPKHSPQMMTTKLPEVWQNCVAARHLALCARNKFMETEKTGREILKLQKDLIESMK
jgi:hypothetical protein